MSTALVRQALEFVDPEESIGKQRKRRTATSKHQGASGQARGNPYKNKIKKAEKNTQSAEQKVEENIKKLLALSEPVAEKEVTKKIVQRAVVGKPLIEIEKVKEDIEKSILFPEDELVSVKKFGRKQF